MGSLNASLSIATQSMLAEQTAIETTTNNIANVNTPGYSRERVYLQSARMTPAPSIATS